MAPAETPDLALLISCVGRRMVLQPRTEEEVESVREVLGPGAVLTGFIYDAAGSYIPALLLFVGLTAVAGICGVAARRPTPV